MNKFLVLFLSLGLMMAPGWAMAQTQGDSQTNPCNSLESICNQAGSETSWTVEDLAARVISTVLAYTGIIFLLLFIYAGVTWMTAGGNSSKIEQAKKTMLWAVFGLVVIFLSYAILTMVFTNIKLFVNH